MKLTPLLLLIPLLSGAALADPQCTQADKSKWMSEADAQQQKATDQQYQHQVIVVHGASPLRSPPTEAG